MVLSERKTAEIRELLFWCSKNLLLPYDKRKLRRAKEQGGNTEIMKKKIWIRAGIFFVLILMLLIGLFRKYTADYYRAEAYEPQSQVKETEDYIVYGSAECTYGFIFYPGAKVEETAYAPVLDALAQSGICCVTVKMPYHLAVLRPSAAEQVMEELSGVKQWYIGGHSLGGAMAADFAGAHEDEFRGLVLLAAYPTAELPYLPVLSVYGDRDKVLNREKYQSAITLAAVRSEQVIEGGNHAGFGNYGSQDGDGDADIPAKEQWQMTVDYIWNFMQENGKTLE